MAPPLVHPSSIVEAGATIGEDSFVGPFSHVRAGATIGVGCVLGQGCYVGAAVRIGDRSRIQNGVSLFDGVVLEEEVFLGPHCVFTNVTAPRASVDRRGAFEAIRVALGVTVGANATILPGVTLAPHAFIAAGAVVTRDVAPYALVIGRPATLAGHRSRHGAALHFEGAEATCPLSGWRYVREGEQIRCADWDDRKPLGARVRIADLGAHG